MPVTCQTHDLWKALMKYKQFQVSHSIKLLMARFHCLSLGSYQRENEFLMRENSRLNYAVIMISGRGLAYKCVYMLSLCVGYKTRSYCIKPSWNARRSGFKSRLQLQDWRCEPTAPSVSSQLVRTPELPTSHWDSVWKPVQKTILVGLLPLNPSGSTSPQFPPISNLPASSTY